MKIILQLLVVFTYLFTAQFTVHAFAMIGELSHWKNTHTIDSSSIVTEHNADQHHCNSGSVDTDLWEHQASQDHENHDMNVCLTQSEGVVMSIDTLIDWLNHLIFVPTVPEYKLEIDGDTIRHWWPWESGWDESVSFTKFLWTHYWSVVMHC